MAPFSDQSSVRGDDASYMTMQPAIKRQHGPDRQECFSLCVNQALIDFQSRQQAFHVWGLRLCTSDRGSLATSKIVKEKSRNTSGFNLTSASRAEEHRKAGWAG